MIQEFKDEVLDTNLQPDVEPRYTIRDNAGNVLNDNVKIELKTPVIENGTPLNKATMGNIQGDLYTVDRYTNTVVTDGIEYRMMPTEGNIFPTEWEDISTGTRDIFRANGITISAPKHNFTNSDGGEAALNKAFDNYVGSGSGSGYKRNTSVSPLEILIDFDTPTKITKTKISFGMGSTTAALISNVYIKGSKNNSEWVTLLTYPSSSTNTLSYHENTLANPDYYSTYKIEYVFTASDDDPTRIQLEEFQTTEYYSLQPVTVYTHNLSLPLTSYEVGKIVNIEGSSIIETKEITKTGNLFPTSWNEEVKGTKYSSSDGYVIEANSVYSQDYPIYYAFDNNDNTYWVPREEIDSWIMVTLPKPIKISKMNIKTGANPTRESITVQGQKDNGEWVILYTTTESIIDGEIELSNTDYYSSYKFYIARNSAATASIYKWETSEYKVVEEGTETTSFEKPYLNINNLGAKQINGTIEKGQKYSLVYNGESWDVYPNKRILTGSFVVTNYSGSASFGETLPKIPTVVAIAQPTNSGDYGQIVLNITSVRETGFSVYASLHKSSSITTGKCTVYWVAVC